jgi:hypothetical protein
MKHLTFITALILASSLSFSQSPVNDGYVGAVGDGLVSGVTKSFVTPVPKTDLLGYWSASRDGIKTGDTILLKSATGTVTGKIKITGKDWTGSYVPTATLSTLKWVGTPTIDTTFFNHSIDPTSVSQDIDWLHQIFFNIKAHTINADSTESLPRRITEIAIYSTAKGTTDLATLNTYFSVPKYATNGIRTVGPGKTYTSIQAAVDAATAEDTIYVFSQHKYSEDNASFHCLYVAKKVHIIGVGYNNIVAFNSSSRVLFLNTSGSTFQGLRLDGQNTALGVVEESGATKDYIFRNCYITNANRYEVATGNAETFNYCVIHNKNSYTYSITGQNKVFNECYLKSTSTQMINVNAANTGVKVKYCKLLYASNYAVVHNSDGGFMEFKFNTSTAGKNWINTILISKTTPTTLINVRIKGNTFNDGGYLCVGAGTTGGFILPYLGIFKLTIEGNTFASTNTSQADPLLNLRDCNGLAIKDNVITSHSTTLVTSIIHALVNKTTAVDSVYIYRNRIEARNTSGYLIQIGSESTNAKDNLNGNIKIYDNLIYGTYYFSGTPAAAPHGIFVGHQINAKIYRNYIRGCGIGIVVKHSGGKNTSGGIFSNVVINNPIGILAKGQDSVYIVGNTVYNDNITNAVGINYYTNPTPEPDNGSRNGVCKNNIVISNGASSILVWTDALSTGNVLDYNCYYKNTSTNWFQFGASYYDNVAATQPTQNAHSITNNAVTIAVPYPSVAIDGTDLGSAYNIGLNASTVWPSGVVTKQQGATWQIGAYVK